MLGAALAILSSDTDNHGRTFITPLPMAAYEFRPVTVNVMYLPKYKNQNDINGLRIWLTFWLR